MGLYNMIMGAMRWTYRVIAYVALMTDEYPPFQLDQGAPLRLIGRPSSSSVGGRGQIDLSYARSASNIGAV
jgi:hypothetical protein